MYCVYNGYIVVVNNTYKYRDNDILSSIIKNF